MSKRVVLRVALRQTVTGCGVSRCLLFTLRTTGRPELPNATHRPTQASASRKNNSILQHSQQQAVCSKSKRLSQPTIHQPLTARQALTAGQLSHRHRACAHRYKAAPRPLRRMEMRQEVTSITWAVPKGGSYKHMLLCSHQAPDSSGPQLHGRYDAQGSGRQQRAAAAASAPRQ